MTVCIHGICHVERHGFRHPVCLLPTIGSVIDSMASDAFKPVPMDTISMRAGSGCASAMLHGAVTYVTAAAANMYMQLAWA